MIRSFQIPRAYPGVDSGYATFGTFRCAYLADIRFYALDLKIFTMAVQRGFFLRPGRPTKLVAMLPSAAW